MESRIRDANRSFYTLQDAGVCMNGLSPFVSAHVYNIAIRSGLLYGCNSLYISKSNLLDIDKLQGKLLKAIHGLPTRCHTTPILQALGINSCAATVTLSSLDLLKTCLASSSATASFYRFLLSCENKYAVKTMTGRAKVACDLFNINFVKYIINDNYVWETKNRLNNAYRCGVDGVVDSVFSLSSKF